jgi:sentrin-specific protease 1
MVASTPLRSKDLLTLQPGAWLNGEIINAWAELLRIRDAGCTVQGHRRSLFMNSFFLPHLLQGGAYTYKNVEQWTTETKLVKNCGSAARTIFDLDKVVIPVNVGGMHWSLAVIYIQGKKIQFYDSLGHSGDITLQVLQKYVVDELASKLGGPEHQEPPQERPDPSTYSLVPTEEDSPRQGNGSDCGPFTCLTAECVAADRGLDAVEGEVPKFREKHAEQCFREGGLGAGPKEGGWYVVRGLKHLRTERKWWG